MSEQCAVSSEQMISDCRLQMADWRFDGATDLQLPIANLKSAIAGSSVPLIVPRNPVHACTTTYTRAPEKCPLSGRLRL